MKRTNVMLADEQHAALKKSARHEGKTMGELVRNAIKVVYQKKDDLDQRKSVAINAYQQGFISLGKLSEVLGIDTVSTRLYLKQNNIPIKTHECDELIWDIRNA